MIFDILLWGLSIFVVVATLLPFSKLPHGMVRGMAFLREQFFVLAVILAVLMPFLHPDTLGWSMAVALVASAVINLIYIVKFTPVCAPQSVDASVALRGRRIAR